MQLVRLANEAVAGRENGTRQRAIVYRDGNVHVSWGILEKFNFYLVNHRLKFHFVLCAVLKFATKLVA